MLISGVERKNTEPCDADWAQLPRKDFIQWLKFQVLAEEELVKLVREPDKQFSDIYFDFVY